MEPVKWKMSTWHIKERPIMYIRRRGAGFSGCFIVREIECCDWVVKPRAFVYCDRVVMPRIDISRETNAWKPTWSLKTLAPVTDPEYELSHQIE